MEAGSMGTGKEYRIIVDTSEPKALRDALAADPQFEIETMDLPLGDFVVGGGVGVERKDMRDLAASLVDGRLAQQIPFLAAYYSRVILLLEGHPSAEFPEWAMIGAVCSAVSRYPNVTVIPSYGQGWTMNTLKSLARNFQGGHERLKVMRPVKPHDPDVLSEFILAGIPMVGPHRAQILLERFRSVKAVLEASVKDLMGVKGIGPGIASAVRTALDHEIGAGKEAEPENAGPGSDDDQIEGIISQERR